MIRRRAEQLDNVCFIAGSIAVPIIAPQAFAAVAAFVALDDYFPKLR